MARKPTPRQVKAAILAAENVRADKPVSTGEILAQAGYSAAVTKRPSHVTDSAGYIQTLQALLPKMNITPETVVQPIADALEATKQNQFTGEVMPDHSVRLAASDRAIKLMNMAQPKQPAGNSNPTANPELAKAIANGDVSEIQRVIFSQQ